MEQDERQGWMTEAEVKEALSAHPNGGDRFRKWIVGQTCPMFDDGKLGFYRWDVERFIRYNCEEKNEPLAEWD